MQTVRHDSNAEFAQFTHANFGSCPISTLLAAVSKGWLGNYPRITAQMIHQNPPVERATAMGYLDQTRQGQRSTRSVRVTTSSVAPSTRVVDDTAPICDGVEHLSLTVISMASFMNSSDATGRFLITTKSGYNYLLVSTIGGYVHLRVSF